jgi:hypothetical protein
MKPVNKFFYYMAWVGIVGAIAIIVILTYWFVAPYQVLTFKEGNNVLVETTVQSGGYLQVKEKYCKKMALPSSVSRKFLDGVVYQVPIYVENRPVGCHEVIEYVYIPKALPTGKYQATIIYTYKVNPLREINYELTTEFFDVVKE